MDPYLEQPAFWPDFYSRFINSWSEVISERLPDNYEARLDEQFRLIELPAEQVQRARPDIAVFREPRESARGRESATATLEPAVLTLPVVEEVHDIWIEILHRRDRHLVAVLELLSPTNKRGSGRGQYMVKRNGLIMEGVHLVELDLLRDGERLPTQENLPAGEYYLFISRANRRPKCEVYSWTRKDKLPVVPIPLKMPDADILVDLGQAFAIAYERGRYAKSIDYTRPLDS